jgi:flagellin
LPTADQNATITKQKLADDLNADAGFSALGTATVDSANHLIIQSKMTGTSSAVTVVDGGSSTSLSRVLGLTTSANVSSTAISDTLQGQNVGGTVTGGTTASTGTAVAAAGNVVVRFEGSGLAKPVDIALSLTTSDTVDTAISKLTSAVANNATLQAAGIKAGAHAAGSALTFTNGSNQLFSVESAGDSQNLLGFGAWQLANSSTATSMDYTSITAGTATSAGSMTLDFSLGGGQSFSLGGVTLAGTSTNATADTAAINAALNSNSQARAAGLTASIDGTSGKLTLTSTNGTAFRVNETDGSAGSAGFGGFDSAGASQAANASSTLTPETSTFNSGGAQISQLMSFSAIQNGGDAQTISISANDASGSTHTQTITLENNGTSRNAGSIDQAISTINTALQQSNQASLQGIVAVKENDNGQEGIRFLSTQAFQVTSGTSSSGAGLGNQGQYQASTQSSGGGAADISTIGGAEAAVNALATAVQTLGTAQAAVGKGENLLNYAVSLATSQTTNEAASESQIRDANLAQEAANLSRAQILVQAGTAALAQANSAPQQLLSLLQH